VKKQRGMSLIELIIVICIAGVLAFMGWNIISSALLNAKSCKAVEPDSAGAQVLQGEHKLRKMFPQNYFLNSGTQITFAWPLKNGTYAISTLPIEKIRVKFDQTVDTPTIKFCWTYSNYATIDYLMAKHVVYALITVRESDWPAQIQLPLNDSPTAR
jgi:prepilin-type N-terminal cleavage/methylation domain-containing protein